ncbi:MAG: DUF177 domain-containing protein [Francisellaceae bacterium]|jgi:uncharacterized metal-binding protein YceD (DUF177 family)|nr:DUF177 domain-containing protein [Francisellaceae bacterium]MBT6208383.1 DUF177 domain-containing protein [Francisellaceae bacterium]MBT6538176.1 DUF177 domain-containing protein [Francisellaceae bacterium]
MQSSHAKYINPVYLLESGELVSGKVKLSSLKDFLGRVDNIHLEDNQHRECGYTFRCILGEGSRICITGKLTTQLKMICQRCMEKNDFVIEHRFTLYPIKIDHLKSLPKDLDPLIMNEKRDFSVYELVSEELLLAVPFAPKHEDCSYKNT